MSVLIEGSPSIPGDSPLRGADHRGAAGFAVLRFAVASPFRWPRSGRFRSARTATGAASGAPRSSTRGRPSTRRPSRSRRRRPSGSPRRGRSSSAPGHYLAFDEGDGEYVVVRLEPGWTRIGRSGAADVRLDDATVSRRHALVVLTESGELRALDDRSLNGLFVNGERVDWAPLADGDELEVGRYRLYVLEA